MTPPWPRSQNDAEAHAPEVNPVASVEAPDRANGVFDEGGGEVEGVDHGLSEVVEFDVLPVVWQDAVVRHGV